MAETIIIRIIDETKKSAPSPSASSTSNTDTPNPGGKTRSQTKEDEQNFLKSQRWAMMKRAGKMILAEADYYVGKYYDMTENYAARQAVSNAKALVQNFSEIADSAIMGFTASGGNPVVAAVMAAVTLGKQALGRFKEYESEATKIIQNAYSNYFYGERAGYLSGGHGTEN